MSPAGRNPPANSEAEKKQHFLVGLAHAEAGKAALKAMARSKSRAMGSDHVVLGLFGPAGHRPQLRRMRM
ncbi:uncharacterized protein BDCG_17633 [Blastomyces dermatitidis ER-3]|uniref:Clp R domain-containing protein n=1 Tax=Ajellomyces dermatitidis (strain ER-3 / ATCC MYA-2586) TaxID=559297 RepID=A0ABX2VZJ1_AJEDR|nr:uncharacterized protein BDCG_17633 [Blastomyces dermatitidis ER-3]EQL33894.1 hypothetical protein BDFG_04168 [Blastomyces dermatitidis ATCC 26199]OAT02559.1 hypothetical protein BDCG_17633 [Blastomyces dermatitidis ER-3]